MNSERWQKIKGLLDAALELAPNQRELFFDKSYGNKEVASVIIADWLARIKKLTWFIYWHILKP
jgi:hypothetical protein